MYGLPEHVYDWGDFHKFAVIFFSFFGTFVILGAILVGLYFGCFRAWLDRFRDEVAETHRLHHPWPVGSARWYFQKLLKTNRSSSSGKFPPMSASLSRFPQGELIDVPQQPQTNFPIYEPERTVQSPSIAVDKAGYYTPSGNFSPTGKLEKIEEYRLIREESTLSRGSGNKPYETSSRAEDRIVRTTTTQHNQQILRPATYI